jgi:hypothetical protein
MRMSMRTTEGCKPEGCAIRNGLGSACDASQHGVGRFLHQGDHLEQSEGSKRKYATRPGYLERICHLDIAWFAVPVHTLRVGITSKPGNA